MTDRPLNILVLNAGSSSQKCSFFSFAPGQESIDPAAEVAAKADAGASNGVSSASCLLWSASISWTGERRGKVSVQLGREPKHVEELDFESRQHALIWLLSTMWTGDKKVIDTAGDVHVVGHRIVHGGATYDRSVVIDQSVKAELNKLSELAPEHAPANMRGIEVTEGLFKNAAQVAVFDTSFHSTMPLEAIVYAAPYDWYQDMNIRRYGFHGISHQYCVGRAGEMMQRHPTEFRLITCHLGGGCSIAAIKDGKSVMTSMGYTPLEGLIMGTRSGTIDPGIIIHLINGKKMDGQRVAALLNEESGIKGVSGISQDMAEIVKAADGGDERAGLAVRMFVRSVSMHAASYLPLLGGLDGFVFTAGIGENSARIRKEVCEQLAFLGAEIDNESNERGKGDRIISAGGSKLGVMVVEAKEEWAIACEIHANKALTEKT